MKVDAKMDISHRVAVVLPKIFFDSLISAKTENQEIRIIL